MAEQKSKMHKALLAFIILLTGATGYFTYAEFQRQERIDSIQANLVELESKTVKFHIKWAASRAAEAAGNKKLQESLREEAWKHSIEFAAAKCEMAPIDEKAKGEAISDHIEACRKTLYAKLGKEESGFLAKAPLYTIVLAAIATIAALFLG